MSILIKNATLITGAADAMVLTDHCIGIKDDLISFICPSSELPPTFQADKIIDARDMLVMPGLVNAHTHSGTTILRNYAGDKKLEDWLFNHIIPAEMKLTPEDVYWGAKLAIIEMLKSGTTSIADMYWHMDYAAQAFQESGMRAVLSKSPLMFKDMSVDLAGCADYYNKWHNTADERLKVYLEVHSTYLYNPELLQEAAKVAKQLNTGIHIHLLETRQEQRETYEKYKMSGAELCEKCGIFDVPVIAAHCVHLDEQDYEILARHKVNVIHNPTSNLKLGSGIANVPKMLQRGINVALGTDGAASNNNLSLFKEMNLAALLHNGVAEDPLAITSSQAIAMATANGAKALGLNTTGVLQAGKKADLILLSTKGAHINPITEPLSAAVYSAQASDVDTVIIDGKILLANKQLIAIDEELVIAKVKEIASRIIAS